MVAFYLVLDFDWLGRQRVAPDLSSTLVDTGTGEVSLSIRSSCSRVSLSLDVTVGDEDELEEDAE